MFIAVSSLTNFCIIRQFFHIILITAIFFLSACDTINSHYPTAGDARKSEEFKRQRLPKILPDSAFDITESYNFDLNISNGSFRFAARDSESFRAHLTWDPLSTAQGLDEELAKLQRNGYIFYTFEKFSIAVNWKTYHAVFWHIFPVEYS
ncbi:MAG: hypothetical protein JGK24_15150 [Microcoleus sp. PH2017_29_MFU_D_A]|uniref:hypothetical protein n=1 Tax=unclassified Microcoleus TaxID=2642155 RepID=UPI001D38E3F7|nr:MULTISPECIES: hypothetical protein [unclassified Microcoleus]MCC3416495.1 hypothetical protein [Microcoleus sp. PH2017_07_MST_O_A]MCC3507798.1 hypothetical protein [Microcoleus sp. PH2017_17_BER_D_A]TAG67880.1 MAG: hypothetical protein EAZ25_05670 [Oscillatoriales cyanobacterium]MCC3423815.1 hypothetical protein [Microcoleus sp. PH2017_01_SCD_O_A]MCC3452802.1 hypothetical protein [Microcoleus sp. PH2017_08_TRC_O_A]